MARPKKLLDSQQGNLTEEQIRLKKKEEDKLYNYAPIDFDELPTGLLPEAYSEWNRLKGIISDLPISELDQALLVMYCNYYFLYIQSVNMVSVEGGVDGNGKQSPWVKNMNDYAKQLKTLAGELGLSINARLRIVNPKELEKEEDDPFKALFDK